MDEMLTFGPKPGAYKFPLYAFYLANGAWGIVQCFTQNGGVYFFFSALIAITATMWVIFDAQHRRKPLASMPQFAILVLWPIAVPGYLIVTRGVRGIGWLILNFIGLVATNMIAFYTTFIVLFGPDALL